jgi:hypothetical protein
MKDKPNKLPVVVVGAGPVGLAAAAHLIARGEEPLILEAGEVVGESVRKWGHVRLFSPWRYGVDTASAELLERQGWERPDPEAHPTGRDLVERYLEPLAATPEIAPRLRLGTRVESITRFGVDKMKDSGREQAPFVLRVRRSDGSEEEVLARAVIDASGTWTNPNPLGAGGVPALGERRFADRIAYGVPDVLGAERARYAGKTVLVVGAGHSAFNAILDLARLAGEETGTAIVWAIRRDSAGRLFGGGEKDALPARGELGARVRGLVESGRLRLVTGFRALAVEPEEHGLAVVGEASRIEGIDEIVVATGARPDLAMLSELRLDLDPAVESPQALAPLIDPNVHSCGTVRPHGAEELKQPEPGLYIVGMKSYGRAPTFLLLTGYEQVRSVAAALVGDWEAAREVRLELPETGVCSFSPGDPDAALSSCCAPAAAAVVGAIGKLKGGCGS